MTRSVIGNCHGPSPVFVRFHLFTFLSVVLFLIAPPPAFSVEGATSNIRQDETILFYPASAWRDASVNEWVLPIRGSVFEAEGRKLTVAALSEVLEIGKVELNPRQEMVFEERARFFLADAQRGKRVIIALGS